MLNRFRYFFTIYLLIVFILFGCNNKTNKLINHKREGYWISVDTLDYVYITKGRYHNDIEIGTWKHFYNGKLVRKERYKNNICKTKFYYPNGKLMQKGFTKFENDNNQSHWFYFGEWSYYNKKGELDSVKNYEEGKRLDNLFK